MHFIRYEIHLTHVSFPGAVTALMTNPIWVVKVRLFTTRRDSPTAYRGLWGKAVYSLILLVTTLTIIFLDGLFSIYKHEGMYGLYRGTSLALFGVSNGALQFMAYEQLKWLCFEQKRRQYSNSGKPWTIEAEKLVRYYVCLLSSSYGLTAIIGLAFHSRTPPTQLSQPSRS